MTFGVSTSASVICHWCHVMLMPSASHDQKNHVTPHFSHLDPKECSGAIFDATAASGITGSEKSCCISF